MHTPQTHPYTIHRLQRHAPTTEHQDAIAVEAPLEIRLEWHQDDSLHARSVAITMRTPSADAELAAGFLFNEGIIRSASDLEHLEPCGPPDPHHQQHIIKARLNPNLTPSLASLERHFYTTSSCGICGKASLDAVATRDLPPAPHASPRVLASTLLDAPQLLRRAQPTFSLTGGLHGCALLSPQGQLIAAREDVGRHNALDKLIGYALLHNLLPLHDHILILSGRISFELVQKAVCAQIPIIAAVGAPSSLAIDLARRYQITLVGFIRDQRMNVYHDDARIQPDEVHT